MIESKRLDVTVIPIIISIIVGFALIACSGFWLFILVSALSEPAECCGSETAIWPNDRPAFTQRTTHDIAVYASVGALHFVAAILMWIRKRIGLILAVIIFGIQVLFSVYVTVTSGTYVVYTLDILLGSIALYCVLIAWFRRPSPAKLKNG
jgi:hypothetical protein